MRPIFSIFVVSTLLILNPISGYADDTDPAEAARKAQEEAWAKAQLDLIKDQEAVEEQRKKEKEAEEKKRQDALDNLFKKLNKDGRYVLDPEGNPPEIDPRIAPYVRLLFEERERLIIEKNMLKIQNEYLFNQNINLKMK